ncbi:hypothetical protein ABPG72_017512 [Tetrahymena utriculariae]
MLESLKNFLINVDFSLKEIPNQDEKIDAIYKSYFQNSRFTLQEIQNYFNESQRLIKKHIDSSYQTFDQFEQCFKKDFEDYFIKINTFLPNKELTYILLTQVYQSNVQKCHLQKLIDRYEGIELEHYCLKQEYLTCLATKFGQSNKLTCVLEKQMNQLMHFQKQENQFLQEMKEMKKYLESEEFISNNFQIFNSDNIRKIERSANPVLPNFFINLNMAKSLSEMSTVRFSEKIADKAYKLIYTQKEITRDENQMLDCIKGLQDAQNTPYLPISLISNSRTNHQVIIQKILGTQRDVVTSSFDENANKIYEGDLIGFLERKKVQYIDQRIVILTTPGLDETPSQSKFEEEMKSFQNLRMNIKDFSKRQGDSKGYSKQLDQTPQQKEENSQLFTIFQLMKKAIICIYLICSSNTIYVVLQDNQQDFTLYQQIKLICSNFLGDENSAKEINFIHFCPDISDIKSKYAEIQYQKIKNKFNLKDSASDFQNECFMKFEEKEDSPSHFRSKLNKRTSFLHLMLFGDFESFYNQQLFGQVQKDVSSTKCDKIVPNLIENDLKKSIFQSLTHFFQHSEEKQQDQQENTSFQFKERLTNNINQNNDELDEEDIMQEAFIDWKDLVFYPYSFLTPNPIKQEINNN